MIKGTTVVVDIKDKKHFPFVYFLDLLFLDGAFDGQNLLQVQFERKFQTLYGKHQIVPW